MVPQIPRYGGGIKMYWNYKILSDSLLWKKIVKMEEKTRYDIQREAFLTEKEKNTTGCPHHERDETDRQCLLSKIHDGFACEGEIVNRSRAPIFQECFENIDTIVENQKQNLLLREENSTKKVSHSTVQANTRRTIDQSNVDHVPSLYHDSKSFAQNKAIETEFENVSRVWEKENFPRLIDLMDVLKNLGVKAQPGLYTKLNDKDKQYWSTYLQNSGSVQVLTKELKTTQLSTSKPSISSDDKDLVYCKNLFLKDRKGQFYLVITRESCPVDLKQLKHQLNAARNLSFPDEASLARILQLKPGEVTPFAIMFESAKNVRIVFHESLSMIQESDTPMAFHPFSPWLQLEMTFSELNLFIMHHGKQLEVLSHNQSYEILKQQPKALLKQQQFKKFDGDVTENVISKNQTYVEQHSCHLENVISACCPKDWPQRPDVNSNGEAISICFLKEIPQSDIQNNEITEDVTKIEKVNNDCMAKKLLKHTKSDIFKNSERKGKLKSFIKKRTKQNKEDLHDKHFLEVDNTKDARESNSMNKMNEVSKIVQNEQETITLNGFSTMARLPEIGDFYKCLTDCKINYHEVNVSNATSKDFGPSLGVKCHLLKDRRKHFSLVICHEFYELDYGRLKKALHPKKKLDACDVSEIMEILGVDFQHLTPFAVMNVRARENQVSVFFTEKIIAANIILCIQHPFAQGSRILMSSSDLQSLLAKFSFNGIDVIEEKVWPKKYNRPFSQFDDTDINQTNHHSLKCSHQDMTSSQCKDIVGQLTNTSVRVKSIAEDKDLLVQTDESIINLTYLYSFIACGKFKNLFLKCFVNNFLMFVLDDSSNSFFRYFDVIYNGWKFSGSLRAKDDLLSKTRSKPDDNAMRSEKYLSKFEDMKSEPQECNIDDGLSLIGKSDLKTGRDIELADAESEIKINPDYTGYEVHSNMKQHAQLVCQESCKTSIQNIQDHLNEHHVKYKIGNRCKENHADFISFSDESFDENDRTSQICYTLHLVDESGKTHYLIVGGDSEHIPVKRFCRRFQISKKLSIINENELSSLAAKSYPSTNPFSIFLSTNNVEGLDDSVKYKLVLYTSIFMDPDMECVFVLDQAGTSVCMSSEEFENYGKRVGMEVWYMP